MKVLTCFSLLVLLTAHSLFAEQSERKRFPIQSDDTIAFLGDSITQQRTYADLIEGYLLTRFPDWNLRFRNLGWNGDTSGFTQRGGLEKGLERDVLPQEPTLILVAYGINDARVTTKPAETYRRNLLKLYASLKEQSIRLFFVSPLPREVQDQGNYDATLKAMAEILEEKMSSRRGLNVYEPFAEAIAAGGEAGVLGGDTGFNLTHDGVHPTPGGHLLLAWAILKELGAPPMKSVAKLDGAKMETMEADGCKIVWGNSTEKGGLLFRRFDEHLPMPIPDDAKRVLAIPGVTILEDLADYRLIVENLPEEDYMLKINGESAGVFPREELAQGIDLNFVPSPNRMKVAQLWTAIQEKNQLFYEKWRDVETFELPEWLEASPEVEAARQRTAAILDGELQAKEAEIAMLRKPEPQIFELIPIHASEAAH